MGWWAASFSAKLLIAEEIGRGTASAVPVGLQEKLDDDDDDEAHLI